MRTSVQNAYADAYDRVSIVLHWLTAFLVIAVFALALAPGVLKGSIALHNTLGVLLLVILPVRLAWRFMKGGAVRRAESSRLMRLAATCVHGLIYVLLIAVPLLGLLYVDAKSIDFRPFGMHLPEIVGWNRDLAQSVYFWKTWAAYGLLALVFLHAAAAIVYHHLFRRDSVLASMLWTPPREAGAAVPVMAGSSAVPVMAGSSAVPVMAGSAAPARASSTAPARAGFTAVPVMAGSAQAQPSAPDAAFARGRSPAAKPVKVVAR